MYCSVQLMDCVPLRLSRCVEGSVHYMCDWIGCTFARTKKKTQQTEHTTNERQQDRNGHTSDAAQNKTNPRQLACGNVVCVCVFTRAARLMGVS